MSLDPKVLAILNGEAEDVKPNQRVSPEALEALNNPSFSASNMVANIPSSAGQVVNDIWTAVSNPIDTITGMGRLAGSAFAKGEEAMVDAVGGLLGDGAVEGLNRLNNTIADSTGLLTRLPESREDMVAENTEIAEAVGAFFDDRYGSWDKTLKTIETDPVGFVTDVSGLLTGGASVLPKSSRLAKIAKTAGAAIDPANLAVNATRTGARMLPKSLPHNLYKSAAKFSGAKNAPDADKLIQTALDYDIPPTAMGVGKLEIVKADLVDYVDNLIDAAEGTGKKVPYSAVFKHLGKLRSDMGGFRLEGGKNLKIIDDIAGRLDRHMKKTGRKMVGPKELNEFKKDIYQITQFDTQNQTATRAGNQAQQAIGRAAKELIEEIAPGNVADANRELGRILDLEQPLKTVAARNDRRNLLSIDTPLQVEAAASMGGPMGGVGGALMSLLSYPNVSSGLAIMLDDINRGLLGSYPGLSLADQAAYQSGRLQNQGLLR